MMLFSLSVTFLYYNFSPVYMALNLTHPCLSHFHENNAAVKVLEEA